jgi:hypothetical protein
MNFVVHSFIVYKNADDIKKSDRIKTFFYSCLFVIKHLWNMGIKLVIGYKKSCLLQTKGRTGFADNLENIRFVVC